MVNNKFGIIKRFALFLGGMLLFGNYALAETVTLKTTVDNYVQGFHQFATVKLYANTGDANIGICTLTTELTLTAPVKLDKNNHTSVLEVGDNWLNEYKDQAKCYNAKITAGLKSNPTKYSIPGSLNDILIATMTFKIDETNLASFDLTINCISVQLFNIDGNHYTASDTYRFENQAVSTPSTVTIPILEGFNFGTIAGKEVSIAEDAYSQAPFKLAATNATYFESTEWNDAQGQLVAVVPPQAKFTGIAIERPDGTRNGYGTLFEDEKGKLEIVNGVIEYTQAANYFNEAGFTVWYQVESTSATTPDGKDADSILIKVTPVNDAPVIELTAYEAKEGEKLAFTVDVTDVEGDAFNVNSVKLNGVELPGTWHIANNPLNPIDPPYAPGTYNFISTDVLPYDLVGHPNKTAEKTLIIKITDTNAQPESGILDQNITVNDTDRRQDDPVFNGFDPAEPKTTDDIFANFEKGADKDDDGDDVTAHLKWTWTEDNEAKTYEGDTLPKEKTKKGIEYTFRVHTTTNPYGDEDVNSVFVGDQIIVLNSAPVAQDLKVFIRKVAGGDGKKEFNLVATDADGDIIVFSKVDEFLPQKGALDIVGNKATYTVKPEFIDQEFYDGAADTFKIKADDGDGGTTTFNVTVTYRANPPAEITVNAPALDEIIEVDEVDRGGNPSSIIFDITAKDDPLVQPAGIKKIAWEVVPQDERAQAEWTFTPKQVEFPAPQLEQPHQCTLTLPGYDTITGYPRPENAMFTVTVTVTDALDVETTATWTVKVTDSDRRPTAPTTLVFDPPAIGARDAVTATADGGTDADGDAIGYEYEWYTKNDANNYDLIATGAELPADNPAIKKGNTLYVRAYSITNPYGFDRNGVNPFRSANYFQAEITVGNTAPVFESFGPDNEDTKYTWEMNEDCETQTLVIKDAWVNDPDVTDGVDSLTYAINSEFGNELGELSYDPETKTISFKPAKDVNALNLLPAERDFPPVLTFKVVVSDDDGPAAEPATVNILILPVNDRPVLDAIPDTIYIVPDEMGKPWEKTYTISMGGGADEENQAIAEAEAVVLAGADIFEIEPVALKGEGDHDLIITFTVDKDAVLGSEAEFKITVQDDGMNGIRFRNGNDNTASKTIKVVLGATPWYPIYTLPCNEHPIHQVTILEAGKVAIELIVEGDTLQPGDYYEAGCTGFPSGAEYTVELRPWTASEGAGELCQLPDGANILKVPEYNLPGEGTLVFVDTRAEKKTFRINVPMSASYTLTIENTTTGAVKTVKRDFTPNAAGLIPPEVDLEMDFFAVGDYVATVFGTNPEGDGPESDELEFTIEDASADKLEWPTEGFVPAESANILIPENLAVATINFSWPVLSAAQSYNIVVINSAGAEIARGNGLVSNTWRSELPAPKNINTYTWWVEAVSAKQRAVSFTWGFNVVKKTKAPLLNSVIADDTGVILNFAAYGENPALVSYEVQYFSVDPNNVKNSKWYNFSVPNTVPLDDDENPGDDAPTSGRLDLELPVNSKAGDFILLRAFYNGKQQGNFELYSVRAAD